MWLNFDVLLYTPLVNDVLGELLFRYLNSSFFVYIIYKILYKVNIQLKIIRCVTIYFNSILMLVRSHFLLAFVLYSVTVFQYNR